MDRPQVVAFDVFGTVVDLSGADREEVRAYARHIRRPEWAPLSLPASWERLPPHPDSVQGIERLRTKFFVCALSNGPLGMMSRMAKNAGLRWDCVIPLELGRVFKPDPRAYLVACDVLGVPPSAVLMVSANKDFGDIEASRGVGMQSILIRHPGGPRDTHELADQLGCPPGNS